MDVNLAVMIAGLVIQGGALIAAGIWKFGQQLNTIRAELIKHQREVDAKLDDERRMQGETLSALRQKINDVELDVYKNFVRRESFMEFIKSQSSEQTARYGELKVELGKLAEKLDRFIEGRSQ